MEFYEVINTRRSIRQFEDKEIQKEVLERILDAGLKAPSSNHQRRWELVTLTDKAHHTRPCSNRPSLSLLYHGTKNTPTGDVQDCLPPPAQYD